MVLVTVIACRSTTPVFQPTVKPSGVAADIAHYDHLGASSRFALDPDLVASTRPGADDNASGTAAVLELARRLAANPPARSVLLIHFDAEEWGLVGSRAFVQRSPIPFSAVVFMLNLDMVGRLDGRDLLIDGSVGDAPSRDFADSGFHSDYQRVTDVPSRIDVPGGMRIVDVAEGIVRAAARRAWLPRQTSSITTR